MIVTSYIPVHRRQQVHVMEVVMVMRYRYNCSKNSCCTNILNI